MRSTSAAAVKFLVVVCYPYSEDNFARVFKTEDMRCEVILDIVVLLCRFVDSMSNVIGHRQSERALQLGTIFTPAEALKIGLVDSLVDETETVEAARQELRKWLKVPG